MGKLSVYAKNALLEHMFGAEYTPAATVYVALSTTDPASSVTEPVGNGYARSAMAFSAAATRTVIQNGTSSFPLATGTWGLITHWVIYDALTVGNMLAYGAFNTSFTPVNGNIPSIPTTNIQITIDATVTASAGFTDVAVHKMLDLMFRNIAWTQPTIHIAVALATLTDASTTLTEETGTGYARVAVTAWDTADAGHLQNTGQIDIGPPTEDDWGVLTSLTVMSAASAGDILAYDNDNVTDQTPTTLDIVRIEAGAFDLTLD